MKKFIICCLAVMFLQGTAFSQVDTANTHGINKELMDSLIFLGQTVNPQQLYVEDAMRYLNSARKLTNAGLITGSTAHLTLIINTGFLVPDDAEYAYQGIAAVLGIGSAATRITLGCITPFELKKAEKSLRGFRDMPGNEEKYASSLRYVSAAKKASIAVPVFGATGIVLMILGYTNYDDSNLSASNNLFAAAWVCAGAGLVTTIISSAYISKARKSMQKESGTVSLGVNKYGIGIGYRF